MLPTFICVIIILSITCIQFLIGKVFDICSMILNIGGAWLGILFLERFIYVVLTVGLITTLKMDH